jgi:hypothetical protein
MGDQNKIFLKHITEDDLTKTLQWYYHSQADVIWPDGPSLDSASFSNGGRCVHCKKVSDIPAKLFPAKESLVSGIWAGEGKIANLIYS